MNILKQILQIGGMNWNPEAGTINGIPYAGYTNPLTVVYWATRTLLYVQEFRLFQYALFTNPVGLLQGLSSLTPLQIVAYLSLHPVLAIAIATSPLYSLAATAPAAAALPRPRPCWRSRFRSSTFPLVVPAWPRPRRWPTWHRPPASSRRWPGPVAVVRLRLPHPQPRLSAVRRPRRRTSAGPGFFPYAVGAGPSIGFRWNSRTGSGTSAQAKAPEPDIAAVAAAAAARRRKRRRRKQDEPLRAHADEFADLSESDDPDILDEALASEVGAGRFGFAGTVSGRGAQASGLTVLAGDNFGGGPTVPLMPGSWDPTRKPAGGV